MARLSSSHYHPRQELVLLIVINSSRPMSPWAGAETSRRRHWQLPTSRGVDQSPLRPSLRVNGSQNSFKPLADLESYDFEGLTREERTVADADPGSDKYLDEYLTAESLTGNVGLDDDTRAAASRSL